MVETNRGGGDKLHLRTLEQCLIAERTSARDEHVCLTHILSRDFRAGKIDRLAQLLGFATDERYFVVDDEFHYFISVHKYICV